MITLLRWLRPMQGDRSKWLCSSPLMLQERNGMALCIVHAEREVDGRNRCVVDGWRCIVIASGLMSALIFYN